MIQPSVKPLSKKNVLDLLTVLVTGATGFIGEKLVERLLRRGDPVTALRRSSPPQNPQVKVVTGDLTYPDFVFPDEEYDVVYHLAAAWPGEKDKKIQRKVNYDGTVNLFSKVKDKAKFFVYVSGLGVFGDPKEKIIDENSSLNPKTDYAKIRLEAQKYLEDACKEQGIPFSVAYLGDVYGNGGWFKSIMVERLRKGSFKIPGSGKYFRSFVHVDDVVSALVAIAEKNQTNQSFVVTDSNPVMFYDFLSFLCGKLGLKIPGTIPTILAKAILGSDFVNLLTTSIKTSNGKILKLCDFTYPSYQEGITAVISEANS
jgi:nucleoside-diphosphate-sugar epimerase